MLGLRLAIDSAVRTRPLLFGIVAGTANGTLADTSAQLNLEGATSIDRTRLAIFAAFGFAYSGCAQYLVYAMAYPRMAATLTHGQLSSNMVKSITLVFDHAVQVPFFYFPIFYSTGALVSALHGERPMRLHHIATTWRENVVHDVTACAAFWVPANVVNFWVVPPPWRVPYMNLLGLVWLQGLSYIRGRQVASSMGFRAS
jgi:hypothetical protein